MTLKDTRITLSGIVVNAGAGQFEVSLSAAASANLTTGLYRCDIKFADSLSRVVSTKTFKVQVLEDVTGAAD